MNKETAKEIMKALIEKIEAINTKYWELDDEDNYEDNYEEFYDKYIGEMEEIIREYAKAKVKEATKEIKADCKIHKTKEGDEFYGISFAQICKIMKSYGYETEIPF